MRTKFNLFLILIFTDSLLVNCSKDETTPTPPAVKKYYISKVKKNSVLAEEFTYNTDNKLIKWQGTDSSGVVYCNFAYNVSGALTDMTINLNSIPFGNATVEMNSSKNPTKVVEYLYQLDTFITTYEYNAGGNLIKLNYYIGPKDLTALKFGYLALTYDTNGNVTREVYNDIPAAVRFQYDYEYDTKNSPLYYNELKWPYHLLLQFLNDENSAHFLSKYNMTKNTQTIPTPVDVKNSTYVYNTDGYPTQMTEGIDVFDIEYIVK